MQSLDSRCTPTIAGPGLARLDASANEAGVELSVEVGSGTALTGAWRSRHGASLGIEMER
jgi:hypothetical protein